MPTIVQPTPAPEFHATARSRVIGITEPKHFVVRWVDDTGQIRTCLVLSYGKTEDGLPGVFILADESKMRENLTIANKIITRGVRDHVSGDALPVAPGEPTKSAEPVALDTTTLG